MFEALEMRYLRSLTLAIMVQDPNNKDNNSAGDGGQKVIESYRVCFESVIVCVSQLLCQLWSRDMCMICLYESSVWC